MEERTDLAQFSKENRIELKCPMGGGGGIEGVVDGDDGFLEKVQ